MEEKLNAEEIKLILKEKGWTQREVGERWNLSERRISQIVTQDERKQYYTDAFKGLPAKDWISTEEGDT